MNVYFPSKRNREGVKYGSKEGRAFRYDPCSFESYEEYERDAKRRGVTPNSRPPRWTRDQWQCRCVASAAWLEEPAAAPVAKRPKGRKPDYVSILNFDAYKLHKKGKLPPNIKNQAQLDVARQAWQAAHAQLQDGMRMMTHPP
jgi:hypothetical protein